MEDRSYEFRYFAEFQWNQSPHDALHLPFHSSYKLAKPMLGEHDTRKLEIFACLHFAVACPAVPAKKVERSLQVNNVTCSVMQNRLCQLPMLCGILTSNGSVLEVNCWLGSCWLTSPHVVARGHGVTWRILKSIFLHFAHPTAKSQTDCRFLIS